MTTGLSQFKAVFAVFEKVKKLIVDFITSYKPFVYFLHINVLFSFPGPPIPE